MSGPQTTFDYRSRPDNVNIVVKIDSRILVQEMDPTRTKTMPHDDVKNLNLATFCALVRINPYLSDEKSDSNILDISATFFPTSIIK